jgi:exodeoxyribonuclease V alpha subunit
MRYLYYRNSGFGDIYVDRNDFLLKENGFTKFELFYDKYNQYKKFSKSMILEAFDRLISKKIIVIEQHISIPDMYCIYDTKSYEMEKYVVEKLICLRQIASDEDPAIEEIIDECEKNSYKLDKLQREAVKNAIFNKLSIISGGPGTGKTLVTKIIVEVYKKLYPSSKIQLCAPTGKASRRMSDVIGMPACTIHKKLGYGSGSLLPITDDLLIVDECSMMDIDLFYKMLSAVDEKTQIVLVGDYNQLPSVGPGLILRDLIDSKKVPSTMLKSVFRQSNGSEIINASVAVLEKRIDYINKEYGKDFVFVEQKTKQEAYINLEGCIKHLLSKGVTPERIQILTPQNEGVIGTTGLNNMMRDICNPPDKRGKGLLVKNTMFFVGDRIIETENDADLGIFNGSIGVITAIADDGLVADFDGRLVPLTIKDMQTVKLGYAITVHKSQGSEFDYVFMPLFNEHEFTLNKNLLYTAITRAKKMFLLLGQNDTLLNTIEKEIVWDRKSQIKDKLQII